MSEQRLFEETILWSARTMMGLAILSVTVLSFAIGALLWYWLK